jgi:hypothetical protein
MVFSSILQNDGPKPKKFWMKWGTKHTLGWRRQILGALSPDMGVRGGRGGWSGYETGGKAVAHEKV